jgi:hypothetical protein
MNWAGISSKLRICGGLANKFSAFNSGYEI